MGAHAWWAVEDALMVILAFTCFLWTIKEWRGRRFLHLATAGMLTVVFSVAVLSGLRMGVASGLSMAPGLAKWNLTLVSVPWWEERPVIAPGEVVVFAVVDGTAGEKVLAKRVVAVEGQSLVYQAGQLTVDGHALVQDWEGPVPDGKPPATQWKRLQFGERKVSVWAPLASMGGPRVSKELGKDEFFVIGDHWANSWDSRDFGPVQSERIRGKVLAAWSWENGWKRL